MKDLITEHNICYGGNLTDFQFSLAYRKYCLKVNSYMHGKGAELELAPCMVNVTSIGTGN
jgi:hypothetical protein